MTPQTRRRVDPLVHCAYRPYAPRTSTPPGLVWDAPGRHADLQSTI